MPDQVVRENFDAQKHLAEFQGFDCGQETWEREVADWISAHNPHDNVLTDIQKWGTRVWVYYNNAGELVGFGSLGQNAWTLPGGRKKVLVSIIPMLGVKRCFWGLPKGDSYASQMIDDLRAEAEPDRPTHPVLALCVHPANQRALLFYKRKGFAIIEPPLKDGYLRMALYL